MNFIIRRVILRFMNCSSYKLKIRKEIKKLKLVKKELTYQRLSDLIGIEPSYLSRFLGSSDVHFSDELLFKLLKALEMNWSEIDMIFLLKEHDRSTNPERKRFLLARIKLGRIRRWQQGIKKIKEELSEVVSMMEEV